MTSRTEPDENIAFGENDRVEFVVLAAVHDTQLESLNLEQFEYRVTQPDANLAVRTLLLQLENLYGQWESQFSACTSEILPIRLNCQLHTQIAGAVFLPGLYCQRRWLRATEEHALLVGEDFCLHQLRPSRPRRTGTVSGISGGVYDYHQRCVAAGHSLCCCLCPGSERLGEKTS